MQFIVKAYDGKDNQAYERRLEARDAHLAGAKAMYDNKTLLFAAAMLDEEDKMIGSTMIVEFPSKEAIEKEWFAEEPYIRNKVWEKIEIVPCKVPPFCIK